MRCLEIDVKGRGRALAELDDRNRAIAEALLQSLPIEASANLWGDEVYFNIPLKVEDGILSHSATKGDICYWSPGPAFCIFFGSSQPYSPVNHLGKVVEGLGIFRNVGRGCELLKTANDRLHEDS